MLHSEGQAQLRRAPSTGTNASGIAVSIVDAESLAHFPQPPDEIPLTPLLEHAPSPSRSAYGGTPPVTPSRKHFRIQPPASDLSMPQRQSSQPGSWRGLHKSTLNTSSGTRPAFAQNLNEPVPPVLPLKPVRRNDNVADTLHPLTNTDEWHEGSSKIIVGRAEERMLSTSFITGLLSSTEEITSSNEHPYNSTSKNYPPSYTTNDGVSDISELTYPPPPGPIQRAPSEADLLDVSLPPRLHPHLDHSQSSQTPQSFLALDADGHSVAGSNETFDGNEPYGGSVIRTASTIRKLGARGASVVGFMPATLRRVSLTPSGPSSAAATTNSHLGKGHESISSMPSPDDEVNAQRLTIPDFHAGPSSTLYSPAQRSSLGVRNSDLRGPSAQPKVRQSIQSTKTTKSFVSSFIHRFSTVPSTASRDSKSVKDTVISWFRLKPLPPLPAHHDISIAAEAEHRKVEDRLPLPELVNRADVLKNMLEKGHHPHNSFISTLTLSKGRYDIDQNVSIASAPWQREPNEGRGGTGAEVNITGFLSRTRKGDLGTTAREQGDAIPDSPKMKHMPLTTKRRMLVIGFIAAVILALVLGIGLGMGLAKKKHTHLNCPGNFTGNACNLDATCVCTSSLPGQCDALAKSVINLLPILNTFFGANYTPNTLSTAVWQVQGAPSDNQCANQALLVDVAPALDSSKAPNRTQWTQSAMLWNLVQSQNMSALSDMQKFISNAPWSSLGETDGPVPDTSSKFSVLESGFIFDFAAQTVTQPSVPFVISGAPTSAQIAQVGSTASSALDRMYSFAQASSIQRQQAMINYWRTTLWQKPEDYGRFLSTISASPILLPFDATASPAGQAVSSLLTNSSSSPFPIPLACYPSLTSTQLNLLNSIETAVFDLPSASATSQFNISCFADRPIYGVLDILQLRLPFPDSRTAVAKQGVVLTLDTAPRAVVHSGEVVSALPGIPQAQNTTRSQQADPRQYGTLNHLNHVMLDFLSSIPDVNVAIDLVDFVLTSPTAPPSNTTNLYRSLSSIPILEVAVFGTINPSDVSHTVSSFSTPSGSLFFGSDQSLALRDWAINGTNSSVVWTQFAGSAEVVRDTSFTDSTFNSVWDPAYIYLHSIQQDVTVDVGNITTAFQVTGMFSP